MAGSKKIFIDGPAGLLECLWLPAGSEGLDCFVILCHPHPLYGGTMETKLVARSAKILSQSGFHTLRFNFRGVGRSEGSWAEGEGELNDLNSVLDYIISRFPGSRIAVFGFSFGAWIGLNVGSNRSDVEALVAVAPPVQDAPFDSCEKSIKPKLVVYAGRDSVVDRRELVAWTSSLKGLTKVIEIPEADHLFTNEVDSVGRIVSTFLLEVFD